MTNEEFVELDLLCGELVAENKSLKSKIEMLESECSALRDQLKSMERQVYNGPTM